MPDLVVTTDFTQVNNLNTALKSTDTIFVKAVDAVVRESNRFNRITKVLAKTTEETLAVVERAEEIVATKVQQESLKREKARVKEAAAAEREAKRIEVAAKKAADAEAKAAQDTAKAVLQAQKNRAEFAWAMAMQRQKEADMEARAAEKVVASQNKIAYAVQESSKGSRQSELFIQQLGYQVGDFAVQVQSGTSALVAFAQQGTQILGFLPMAGAFGAVAGAVLAVSTALLNLYMNFGSTAVATKTAEEGVNNFVDSLRNAEDYLKNSTASVEDLREKYGKFGQEMKDLSRFLSEVSVSRALESLNVESSLFLTSISDTANQISRLQQDIASVDFSKFEEGSSNLQLAKENVAGLQNSVIQMAGSLGMSVEQVLALNNAFSNVQKQSTMEGIAQAAFDALKMVEGMNFEAGKLPPELANAVEQMEKVLSAASRFSTLDMTSGVSAAASAARQLAEQLGVSVGLAARLTSKGLTNVVYDPRDPNYDPVVAEMAKIQANPGTVSPFDPSRQPKAASTGGGAGGGSKANPLEGLINQLQTEREVINEWYTESQDTLKSASETELEIIGGYNEAKLRLEKEYQDRLKSIRDESQSTLLTDTGNMFSALASVSEAGGKKALRAQAVLSAAATMIAAYETAVKAAAEAKTIPGRIAAYAGFLASGLKAVSTIRSIGGIGGGSGGGGVGSATVAATASAPSPQTVFIDSISPESLYSGETLINLFEAFYDENDKRGKVFVVAR